MQDTERRYYRALRDALIQLLGATEDLLIANADKEVKERSITPRRKKRETTFTNSAAQRSYSATYTGVDEM